MAGPLVEGVESLTLNGFGRIESGEPNIMEDSFGTVPVLIAFALRFIQINPSIDSDAGAARCGRPLERDERGEHEQPTERASEQVPRTYSHSRKSHEEGPFTIKIELRGKYAGENENEKSLGNGERNGNDGRIQTNIGSLKGRLPVTTCHSNSSELTNS